MTTLINKPEESLPETFYVFVNYQNLQTKHNVETTNCICSAAFLQFIEAYDRDFSSKYLKGIISAFSLNIRPPENFADRYINGNIDYLPFSFNYNCSINFISFFNSNITSDYRTEYDCEAFRQRYNPKLPSRLSACYAFGDYESCLKVNRLYGWSLDTVREFVLIPHEYNRVAKVNMEVVSLYRLANRISMLDVPTQQQVWANYWTAQENFKMELPSENGHKLYETNTLWEYLVEGIMKLK